MSKYAPLEDYLRDSGQESVPMTFRRHRASHRRKTAAIGLHAPGLVVQ